MTYKLCEYLRVQLLQNAARLLRLPGAGSQVLIGGKSFKTLIFNLPISAYTDGQSRRQTAMKNQTITRSGAGRALSSHPELVVFIYFLIYVLFVGGAPVAMRLGYAELATFWLGVLRFGLGALVFWALVVIKKMRLPKGQSLRGPLLYGVFGIGLPFVFLSWGLVRVPASLAAIFLALIPLMTVLFSSFQRVEPLTLRHLLGAVLSVAGTIATVSAASATSNITILPIAALVVGSAFLAEGGIIVKRHPPVEPIVTNALAMSVGALILALASAVTGEIWSLPAQTRTWLVVVYLVLFVSGVAFLLYLEVLNRWSVSTTSYGFVITPFITAVISAILLKEQITPNFLIGLSIVAAGVMVGALWQQKEKEAVKCVTC